jgi:hypothetical protein
MPRDGAIIFSDLIGIKKPPPLPGAAVLSPESSIEVSLVLP